MHRPSDPSLPRRSRFVLAVALTGLLLPLGCRGKPRQLEIERGRVASAFAEPARALAAVVAAAPRSFTPSRAGCETIPVFDRGAAAGALCVDEVERHGLTVLDLSDDWTPRIFARDLETGDAPAYRTKYLELAKQPNADLGLYGIAPAMSVLADRLTDERSLACSAGVDRSELAALADRMTAASDDRAAAAEARAPGARPAIRAAQSELACQGLLPKNRVSDSMGASAHAALDAFRRRHMIVAAGSLDAMTARALALGAEELAFLGLLRGLRERVADAAGLLEDGSAAGMTALVAGRALDVFRSVQKRADAGGALPAPDLVGSATDLAARALGWTSPEATRAFLRARGKDGLRSLRLAVELPPPPSYHARSMDLRVEIDRGDVYYDPPGRAAVARKKQGSARGPTFVVYAKDGEREHALVRWSTTIGGWQKERTEDGEVALKYKESDVGERAWRQLVAAPAWLPPDSTPETDILRETEDGEVVLKRDLIQPGYRNAYGLVMLVHEEKVVRGDATKWLDHGIRTHGSVNYRSIERGESHGCHRVYNDLALRLSGFLLQHRTSVRKGAMRADYRRTLEWKGHTIDLEVPVRGYLYELDPPVPVRVLPGRIAGDARRALSTLIRLRTDDGMGG